MKYLFIIIFSFLSINVFSQNRFHVPSDKSLIRNYKNTQDNHLIILKSYRFQIESELRRLVEGIEYESSTNKSLKLNPLKEYFSELLIKNILVTELFRQLIAINLDLHLKSNRSQPVFKTENLSIDFQKEINFHLKNLNQTGLISDYLLKELKSTVAQEIIKAGSKKVFSALGSGLLTKIITNGITSAGIRTAVVSIGSEAFIKAGQGMILTILTLPLHAYRLPPEHVWTDILKENPEIIINPEWMKYAGSHDDPWMSHGYALLRRTNIMEKRLEDLIQNEERSFISRIKDLCKIGQTDEGHLRPRNNIAVSDATYVYRPKPYFESLPFWAIKKQ